MLEEAAPSLVPLRRRALEIALLLAEPGDRPPDAHAIGLAVLDVLRVLAERGPWSSPSTTANGSIRPPPACCRSRSAACVTSTIGLLATLRRTPDVVNSVRARPVLPRRPARRGSRSARSAWEPCTTCSRSGSDWTSPARSSRACRRRRPAILLRARAGPRARPHEHEAGTQARRCACPRACRSCSAAACSGSRVRPSTCCSRWPRWPGRRSSWWQQCRATGSASSRRSRRAVREGVIELDDSRLRFAHPLLASICYERAPLWKRRAVHRALAEAVSDVEERARHLALAADGPGRRRRLLPGRRRRRTQRHEAPPPQRPSSVSSRPSDPADPALARQRRLRAARPSPSCGRHRAGPIDDDRATARGGSVWRRAGATCSSALVGRSRRTLSTLIELSDEALVEAAGDDARSSRILALRAWIT